MSKKIGESGKSRPVVSETFSGPPDAASRGDAPGPSGLVHKMLKKGGGDVGASSPEVSRPSSAAGRGLTSGLGPFDSLERMDLQALGEAGSQSFMASSHMTRSVSMASLESSTRKRTIWARRAEDSRSGSPAPPQQDVESEGELFYGSLGAIPGGGDGTSVARASTAKRGRGRPPTTGQYVGLAKAKEEARKAQREAATEKVEEEVSRKLEVLRASRALRRAEGTVARPTPEPSERLAHELHGEAESAVRIIKDVAGVSKGLKGTCVGALKEAAQSVTEIVEVLRGRTESEEVARLREAYLRLEAEVKELRRERAEAQPAVEPPPPPPKAMTTPVPATAAPPVPEEQMAYIMRAVGVMYDARHAGIEARLPPEPVLRPPLAADKIRGPPPPRPARGSGLREGFPPPPPPQSKKTKGRKDAATAAPPAPPPPRPFVPPPVVPLPEALPVEGGFIVVAREGKKKKATAQAKTGQVAAVPSAPRQWAQVAATPPRRVEAWPPVQAVQRPRGQPRVAQPPTQPPPLKKKGPPRIRENRSAAVVLTLRPEAAQRGVSYMGIMERVKEKINPAELGIEGGMKMKPARTGAMMMVLSGEGQGPKADALAARLKEALDSEEVKVTRPEKTVRVRISGLDEFTSVDEVAGAIERATGCPADQVGTGTLRRGPDGSLVLNVACPVAAANKLAAARKLHVGWASAEVSLLPHRVPRCFRCLEPGHLAAGCTSTADRSRLCYRCGQPGHWARTCTAEPHCCVCAAKGRPAGHRVGGGPEPCTCRVTGGRRKMPSQAPPSAQEGNKKRGRRSRRGGRKVRKQRSTQQGNVAPLAAQTSGPEAMEEGGDP